MAEYTEKDLQDIQDLESKDTVLLMREVKALREELRELKGSLKKEKSSAQKKKEILSIKDTNKRLKAIEQNIELFR